MFIYLEQPQQLKKQAAIFWEPNAGFHGDILNGKRFYMLQRPALSICTLGAQMYTAIDPVYFTRTNLNIICTNLT